jgi:SAM-dependent methyltransferase
MPTRYDLSPCPACATRAATLVADSDDIRRELEILWAFHSRRVRGDTPVPLLHDRIAFSQQPPLRLVRCDDCTLLYRNPRERDETLLDTYRDEAPDDDALGTLFENQKRLYRRHARRLTRLLGRTGTGLEVGSYVGAFLAAATKEGWKFRGIDVNGTVNAFARRAGFHVVTGTIDDVVNERFDAVAFWNCFDQLSDPRAAARAARARLGDDGILAIRVPSGAFYERWRARLDSPAAPLATTLLAHSNLLGFPYRHGFSATSLRRLLEQSGFDVVRVLGDALVPTTDRFTRPWAVAEQAVVRRALRLAPADRAPWLEVYATAR